MGFRDVVKQDIAYEQAMRDEDADRLRKKCLEVTSRAAERHLHKLEIEDGRAVLEETTPGEVTYTERKRSLRAEVRGTALRYRFLDLKEGCSVVFVGALDDVRRGGMYVMPKSYWYTEHHRGVVNTAVQAYVVKGKKWTLIERPSDYEKFLA